MYRILVVDDNQDILHVVDLILKSAGYDVLTLSRGQEALKTMERFKPDLVLLDVYLGSMDGREICKTIKTTATGKNIPVILFSAHASRKEVLQNCNAQDFIGKPFEMKELITKIKYQIDCVKG